MMSDTERDVGGAVWSEVLSAMLDPVNREFSERYLCRVEGRASIAADRILATIREALLSEASLAGLLSDKQLGDRELREAANLRRSKGMAPYSTGAMGSARALMTAALDASGIGGQR